MNILDRQKALNEITDNRRYVLQNSRVTAEGMTIDTKTVTAGQGACFAGGSNAAVWLSYQVTQTPGRHQYRLSGCPKAAILLAPDLNAFQHNTQVPSKYNAGPANFLSVLYTC